MSCEKSDQPIIDIFYFHFQFDFETISQSDSGFYKHVLCQFVKNKLYNIVSVKIFNLKIVFMEI